MIDSVGRAAPNLRAFTPEDLRAEFAARKEEALRAHPEAEGLIRSECFERLHPILALEVLETLATSPREGVVDALRLMLGNPEFERLDLDERIDAVVDLREPAEPVPPRHAAIGWPAEEDRDPPERPALRPFRGWLKA